MIVKNTEIAARYVPAVVVAIFPRQNTQPSNKAGEGTEEKSFDSFPYTWIAIHPFIQLLEHCCYWLMFWQMSADQKWIGLRLHTA